MLQEIYKLLEEILQCFMVSGEDVLYPLCFFLSREAVGGNPEATTMVVAAFWCFLLIRLVCVCVLIFHNLNMQKKVGLTKSVLWRVVGQ